MRTLKNRHPVQVKKLVKKPPRRLSAAEEQAKFSLRRRLGRHAKITEEMIAQEMRNLGLKQ